ncbi:MAG: hypothetical protein DRP66_11535 [Planctomycetota bacterium]|nr:MAG: hypothetical protein DRP66_11535 [Planctomycetota bacterium]
MQIALAVLGIIPALIKIIVAVEEAFPQPGAGKEKLEAVRQILTTAYDGIGAIWPSIEQIVAVIVSLANAIGAFKKSDT